MVAEIYCDMMYDSFFSAIWRRRMHSVKCSPDLAPHPTADGWYEGWAVLCDTRLSWGLKAIYSQESEADAGAAELGAPYRAARGWYRPTTNDFMHWHDVNSAALPLLA